MKEIILNALLVGIFKKALIGILDSTKTEIISEKALSALKDPVKKKKIEDAFNKSKSDFYATGVWVNPEVDLDSSPFTQNKNSIS